MKSQTEIESFLIASVFSGDEIFDTFDKCCELGITSEVFCDHANATIWNAFIALKGRNDLLEEANVLVEVDKDSSNTLDITDIMRYSDIDCSASQWEGFANTLLSNQTRRRIKRELRLGLESIEENEDPEKIVSTVQKGLDNLEAVGSGELDMSAIAKLVYGNLLDENQPSKMYLPTGLTDYDATLKGGGHGEGQLVVYAARPGLGKTTIALNIIKHAANLGNSVGFFSLEMGEEEIGEKLAVSEALVPSAVFDDKAHSATQAEKMNKALVKLSKLPMHIDCRSRSLPQILIKCKIWAKKKAVKMIVIDYCQLIRGDKQLPREQQIAEISRELKLLALDLKIPIILLSQLNRESEKSDRRPIMSDLRESGALEQDADCITFLYLREEDKAQGDPDFVRYYRAKQRGGQTAEGIFGFKRQLGIFTSYEATQQ